MQVHLHQLNRFHGRVPVSPLVGVMYRFFHLPLSIRPLLSRLGPTPEAELPVVSAASGVALGFTIRRY